MAVSTKLKVSLGTSSFAITHEYAVPKELLSLQ